MTRRGARWTTAPADDGSRVIETAAELYREIRRRGLELRRGNGRDDALLKALSPLLGWHGTSLAAHLDKTGIPAGPFLQAFLRVAEPFARMFQEIWDYLSAVHAPRADEQIRVRFGFDAGDRDEVSLEQFREYVERTRTIYSRVLDVQWTPEAFQRLFKVGQVLGSFVWQHLRSATAHYHPGKPLVFPRPPEGAGEFAVLVRRVRAVLESVVEDGPDT